MGTTKFCNGAVCRNGAFSHTNSERSVFTVKKHAPVILFPNYLYFPLFIQEKWTKHWWLSRRQTEVLVNWKTGICQLLQFRKTLFPYFIKVSDMLVLSSNNNKTQLRSSWMFLKTNLFYHISQYYLLTAKRTWKSCRTVLLRSWHRTPSPQTHLKLL